MNNYQTASTTRNISYSAIGKMIAFGFQAIANVIISRELVASDYGIFNFALILVNLMRMLGDVGINTAAVQRRDFNEETLHTAFTLKLLIGLVIYVTLCGLSGYSVYFFDDPSVVSVIRLLALTIIINTFAFMPCTMLSRALRLKEIVVAEAANTIASSAIAITMAVNGFKFWSIVVAFIVSNAVFVLVVNWYQPCRIAFRFNWDVANTLLRYGSSVLFASLVSFAVFNFDNLIVGSVGGASLLGYYALAFNWGSMVCSIIASVVLSVLFPTFSRMQDDPVKMKEAYLKILLYTTILSVLWNLTLFCVADIFLVNVLGKGSDKWLPALVTLRIFCVYGVLRSLIEPTNTMLMASGNAKLVLKSGAVVAIIEMLLIYPAIHFGSIEAVGVVVLVAFASQIFWLRSYIAKIYSVTFSEIGSIIFPVGIVAVGIGAAYFLINTYFSNDLTGLVLATVTVGGSYLFFYGLITNWQHYSRISRLIRQ